MNCSYSTILHIEKNTNYTEMEEELYDEFGNPIGDALGYDYSESDNESIENDFVETEEDKSTGNDLQVISSLNAQTIHIQPYQQPNEDAPVIVPETYKQIHIDESELPPLNYSREYMHSTMTTLPQRIRNFAVIGNLQSGKTSFIDGLISQTHRDSQPSHYTDTHKLEIDRGISIKASPITLLLADLKSKSYAFNIIDTPGHPNFNDECFTALSNVEGALLVLDVVEGLTARDKLLLDTVISENKSLVICLNKLDRLIIEMRLSPLDTCDKLEWVLEQVEDYINNHELSLSYSHQKKFSPIHDNVIFALNLGFSFTTKSFARIYEKQGGDIDSFALRLWGYHYSDGKFFNTSRGKRAFEIFILEPLYKVITHTLTSKNLSKILWDNFGVHLHKDTYKLDTSDLLPQVMQAIFPDSAGLVESITQCISQPQSNSYKKSEGLSDSKHDSELFGKIIKLVETTDASRFLALIRVYSGTLTTSHPIKVVGENFHEDDEDCKITTIDAIYFAGGRYRVPIDNAPMGSIVLVSGIDSIVTKSGEVFSPQATRETILEKFTPIVPASNKSVFKVAVAPENPKDLPRLLAGLRSANRAYVASAITVEESGEIVVCAPGEMYLDCMLHDLRVFFASDIEIKVSDPVAKFSETVSDTSITKISTEAVSNTLSIISEPIEDERLSRAIEIGNLNLQQPTKTTAKILRNDFGWDALAARSVWCFGCDDLISPSILVDDTLEEEGTDKLLLNSVKSSIVQGYKWSVQEGPLCGEPVRNTKFKILDAVLNDVQSSSSQLISLTRRACYTGFLSASPRLMEPLYGVIVIGSDRSLSVVSKLLAERRGYLQELTDIPLTNLIEARGSIPVIESVGFETEVLFHTQGAASISLVFDRWDTVPGDPLDEDCELPALRPVPEESLARDFMLKTRRRKGLADEVSLRRYIDADVYQGLKESGLIR